MTLLPPNPSPPDALPMTRSAESIATSVKGVITLFSYDDLPSAIDFYQRVVGLRVAEDFGWCYLLELQPRTYLGLIDATSGSQHPVAGANKGVLVTIEMVDLDACLERAKRLGVVAPTTTLEFGCRGRTREFRIVDPGGYPVEFFSWVEPMPRT